MPLIQDRADDSAVGVDQRLPAQHLLRAAYAGDRDRVSFLHQDRAQGFKVGGIQGLHKNVDASSAGKPHFPSGLVGHAEMQ
jgi:hypothetical protein